MSVFPTATITLPDRYEPVRRIASGGMATVWCADDRVLGRRVAIKVLSEALSGEPDAEARFLREARAAARLSSHPNVVTIYDVGETDGRGFLVMEHLPGGTVADALRTGAAGRTTAQRWLREAAAALDHAHRQGVVHRDVKPANLLLGRDRVLRVTDFGIARLAGEAPITVTGLVLGSAGYLSPEQAFGHPATAASDRYSLAVTAFELLTGQRPAASLTSGSPLAAPAPLAGAAPPRASRVVPGLPSAVDDVLERGLAEDPAERWPTATAMIDALDRALGTPAGAPTEPFRAAPGEPSRHRARVAAAAVGAAGLAGAAADRAAAAERSRRPDAPPARGSSARGPQPRGPQAPGRGPRVAAVIALGAAVLAALVAVLASGGGGVNTGSGQTSAAGGASRTTAGAAPAPSRAATRPQATKPPVTAPPAATSTADTTGTPSTAAPVTPAPAPADALEASGHAILAGGNAGSAVPVLRRAVAAASPQSLTYAYALYDLGRALRLSGDPGAAIPVLEQRLQIPNQRDVVARELALARAAAGGSGGTAPAPAHHHHGNGNGGDGGGGGGD